MDLSVICFTRNGYDRMRELKKYETEDLKIKEFCKCSQLKEECADIYVTEPLASWVEKQFGLKNAILFIGATGIAVRTIASSIDNKLSDSPVLVMDDRGQYVIPLLSGHVGGANELANVIAEKMGAVAVITTATDINGKFAVDVFAKKNGLGIVNKSGIAQVSSKAVAGGRISICVGTDVAFDQEAKEAFEHKHREDLVLYTEDGELTLPEYDVFIGKKKTDSPKAALYLEPERYVLGIGCRLGKTKEEIQELIDKVFSDMNISPAEIRVVTSVDGKREEEGLMDFARHLTVPFITYPADKLESLEGDYSESEFVRATVGTGCVSERSAMYYCQGEGELILKKTALNGVTAAIAEKKWRLEFYE